MITDARRPLRAEKHVGPRRPGPRRVRRVRPRAASTRAGLAAKSREDVRGVRLLPEPDRARKLSSLATGRQSAGHGVRSQAGTALHDARLHGRVGSNRATERRAGNPDGPASATGAERSARPRLPIVPWGGLETAMSDKTEDFQQQAIDMLRAQQEAYVAAVKAWREALAAGEAAVQPPPPEPTPLHMLPTPTEMAEAYYAFAAKLLADQSRFMDALSQAMAPPKKKP